MRTRTIWIWVLAAATFGSGLINLASVMGGPGLTERVVVVRDLFPLEFIHFSRYITLLTGFALVVSALNICKRKRRAFFLVAALAVLSIVFNLMKGLDYEEATFSLAVLVLLLLQHRRFTVKSSVPNLRWGLSRLALAILLVLGYGIAGFWLVEPHHFHQNFHIGDAVEQTLLFLSWSGDFNLVPQTHYARWFIDSLYLIGGLGIAYALYALFRPVLYQFRTLPHERDQAKEILRQHGRSSIDFFKVWPDKTYFFSPSKQSFLAYRVGGHFAMVLGDPVGPEAELEAIIRDFSGLCEENDWGVAFHQVPPDLLPVYARLGFKRLKIGDNAVVDLTGFNLDGKDNKRLRHYVNQLEKTGIRAVLHEPPLPDDLLRQAREVSDGWLGIPGRRERQFTLGQFEAAYIRSTPLFGAWDARGELQAFANIIPSYVPGEATIDLMRYRPGAPAGIMEFLFIRLFLLKKAEGFTRFDLGMAPLAGFREKEEATAEEKAVHFFLQRLNFLFSFSGLRQYKAKFATIWEPRYTVYRRALDLPRFALALGKVSALDD
jgi:phosphatidylglycerol lysyltransferase